MSTSGRSGATRNPAPPELDATLAHLENSPPVSRAEVLEVFDSWRNSASVTGQSDDSGLGVVSSGQSDGQFDQKGGKRAVAKRVKAKKDRTTKGMSESPTHPRSINSYSSESKQTMNQGGKLPRIGPTNKKLQVSMEERRRFVTVVRPLSVFPEPALPPNYTPPVLYTSQSNGSSNRYHDFSPVQSQPPVVRGRPPSPAPFQQQRQRILNPMGGGSNFSLAGQGMTTAAANHQGSDGNINKTGSAALKFNLAGGSGWDLTAIKRGYNYAGPSKIYNGNYKSLTDRSIDPVARYQSQNGLDHQEEKISMTPWNPHFGYSKVLSQQNLPLTDDWRRHIDARRKALQRRRSKRRGVADGGTTFAPNGDRFYNGAAAQTDGNFEELLRRAGDTDNAIQTEAVAENAKRQGVDGSADAGSNNRRSVEMQDESTQVVLTDIPDYEKSVEPAMEELINATLEQAFVEMLEEEEIKTIRQQRVQFQQMKLAEITTSKLMNIDINH